MRAPRSSSLLRAPLIFHVKIFIYLVEHPGRHRGIVVVPRRAAFGTMSVLVCADCSRRLVSSGSLPRQCIDLQSLGSGKCKLLQAGMGHWDLGLLVERLFI